MEAISQIVAQCSAGANALKGLGPAYCRVARFDEGQPTVRHPIASPSSDQEIEPRLWLAWEERDVAFINLKHDVLDYVLNIGRGHGLPFYRLQPPQPAYDFIESHLHVFPVSGSSHDNS